MLYAELGKGYIDHARDRHTQREGDSELTLIVFQGLGATRDLNFSNVPPKVVLYVPAWVLGEVQRNRKTNESDIIMSVSQ